MTMTSNYDKYVRPEVWPVPAEDIAFVLNEPPGPNETHANVRALYKPLGDMRASIIVIDEVPREDYRGARTAIAAYCKACRKLIG